VPVGNAEIAFQFERVADLLEARGASGFRSRAYRRGADTLRSLDRPVAEVLERGGHAAVVELPGLGDKLATVIEDLLANGRFHLLDHLEQNSSPDELFASVPGIGKTLAKRIHDHLGVETLEELELAAHDGSLEGVRDIGTRRAEALRDVLDGILRRSTRRRARRVRGAGVVHGHRPGVGTLLRTDAQYRTKARADELPRIKPRRFNPQGDKWLPVMHIEVEGWDIDALYSNTARAHRIGRTRDWVVLFYGRGDDEGQCTVVTERTGLLQGRRVVRGRELECEEYYRSPEWLGDAA
jgi:hypothetical protein